MGVSGTALDPMQRLLLRLELRHHRSERRRIVRHVFASSGEAFHSSAQQADLGAEVFEGERGLAGGFIDGLGHDRSLPPQPAAPREAEPVLKIMGQRSSTGGADSEFLRAIS